MNSENPKINICKIRGELGLPAKFGPGGRRLRSPKHQPQTLVEKALASNRAFFAGLTSDQQAEVVRGARAAGMTWAETARRVQHPVSVLQRLADPDAPTFDDQVRDLLGQGRRYTEIAEALNTTRTSVGISVKQQGLTPNFVRGRPRVAVSA